MSKRLPAWFLAHGAPLHALDEGEVAAFWQSLPNRLPVPPWAILVISAHWQAPTLTLAGRTSSPGIQHDFYGFPEALYRLRWPLPDGRDAGARLLALLDACGLDVREESERPFDHGVWVPLCRAWPEMAFPVFQLSLVHGWRGMEYRRLGRRLQLLRSEGVLVIGSGSLTHNLHDIRPDAPENRPVPWAAAFMDGLMDALRDDNSAALANPWGVPHGRRALPTLEHYWPWLVIHGLADGQLESLFRHWQYGTLAMHSFTTKSD